MMDANFAAGRTERSLYQKQIDGLRAEHPQVSGALVSSIDGFEVAASLERGLSPATLSAITSSQLALSEAVCTESGLSTLRNVIIESDTGFLLMMNIPNNHRKLVLTVLSGSSTTLGNVLWAAKQCASTIGAHLDGNAVNAA